MLPFLLGPFLLAGRLGHSLSEVGSEATRAAAMRQDSNRLRTILPNGAVIWAEHVPHAQKLIVQLFVANRSLPTDLKTNGTRHLLEHLSALGPHRDLDAKLESRGAFLTAETLRDATVYQISLRPEDLNLAFDAIKQLMQLGEISADQIAHEAAIIKQEAAIESTYNLLSAAAWTAAYGEDGADPLGDPDQIANVTPAALGRLHQDQFVGANLTLVISGGLDLDFMTMAAKDLLGPVPSKTEPIRQPRSYGHGGTTTADAYGEALACPVGTWDEPKTSARLAAALAIASAVKDSFVTYTPSAFGGLVMVGRVGQMSGLDEIARGLSAASEFAIGRSLAKSWVLGQSSVQENPVLVGLLLSEGPGLNPQTALENLDRMSFAQFSEALTLFKSKDVIRVLGK